MRYKFSKSRRLKKRPEISSVFEKGIRVWDSRMTLVAARRENPQAPWRAAVAVSRKHGPAVMRNRIKRLHREAIRLLQPQLADGWNYIIIPRPGVDFELQNIQKSLLMLMEKVYGHSPKCSSE